MAVQPHALVTGTSSGIGAAVAARLLSDGWQVTGISRRPPALDHPAFRHLPLDLSDAAGIERTVADVAPTALVHAAGLLKVGKLGELAHDDGAEMWRLHVDVAERLANLIAPRLRQGGRIVFIGSRTASGAAGRGQYAATKAALVAMARSWAAELAPRGITVNVVAPAATETPMLNDPARGSVTPKLPPIGRFIRPEEVAAAVAFLLSADAGAITGQQLVICGGSSL
ncbi:SDR family oxidoreductase [Bradyrhizobium jicamae]|uniref:SDR family NAD(P)-dependent oxidoreductase n=1 Tax=Bradyrhizobium jicamae TaxID=280332 RepID=UPI001BA45555|nr:SDR family oxidoreductase [Bradyrhizobium jicamae]MBR0755425.1 SDR family oxidoreductase [Bradyrhizobium jicamae]